MTRPISITAISTISALGLDADSVWGNYLIGKPLFRKKQFGEDELFVSEVTTEATVQLEELGRSNSNYNKLDRSVLLAILAAQAFKSNKSSTERTGINIGSSRGATQRFEQYFEQFRSEGRVSAFTSPTTTLGNISSWVAQELGLGGIAMGHSVTCSTALHAVLNGIAWLQSGMADRFLAGGSEAALTPFTMAQMRALKLYSASANLMACESMRFEKKKNTMVLGEGAGIAQLELGVSKNTMAIISGFGFASERLEHGSSITPEGDCFQRSMSMALTQAKLSSVDVVVMHAPGTVKGDEAEKNAIDKVFNEGIPLLTSNKWLIGHTFGASGLMSLEMAVMMLNKNRFIENPFYENRRLLPQELKTIMVNAVGFGGNAVSIIISKP